MRMFIKKNGFFTIVIMFLTGLLISGLLTVSGKSGENHQKITKENPIEQNTENNMSDVSIPKKTILALICAGLIGLLCIPRKKKIEENFGDKNHSNR